MKTETIVIVGGVAAGATAAARARRVNEHARIILLEAGGYISFANCGLPYYLGREIESRDALILQQPEEFARRYRVDVHLYTEAIAIDRANRTVLARRSHPHLALSEEASFPYDRLILAQGGRPVRPNLPGADRPHVFPLWTIPEMDALDRAIDSAGSAVVLGGGFIGLETAEALVRRGLNVSVVEMAPHVMANLDDEIAARIEQELRGRGVHLFTGRRAATIDADAVILDDGRAVPADLVVLSVGVAPTVSLARDAGLAVGPSGGITVDEFLRTSDPAIFAAGDMIELPHRVSGRVVRLPLAGPANRQGRIAGTNAASPAASDTSTGSTADPAAGASPWLRYRGALGTSVIKLFDVEAGTTGLSAEVARSSGLEADTVTVHKLNHAGYYPGARDLTLSLTYEPASGRVLGAQAVGAGVDKRIDVIATALAGGLTIDDLAEIDLSYAPPFSSANDPVNIAAFMAQNRRTGYASSITVAELDDAVEQRSRGAGADPVPLILDVRTPEEFAAGNVSGALNIELDQLRERVSELDPAQPVLVHCAAGYRAHLATRILRQSGFQTVMNIAGGFTSLVRRAEVRPFEAIAVTEYQAATPCGASGAGAAGSSPAEQPTGATAGAQSGPYAVGMEPGTPRGFDPATTVVVDVRSPEEYREGHLPGAVNLPVAEIMSRYGEIPTDGRRVIVYCAGGSRSEYARMVLAQLGVPGIENGGGLTQIMMKLKVM